VLRPLRDQVVPSELLVGLTVADDAAVWQIAPDKALVSTTDFFPPIVDDAYASGAIAAANAMSDVYAMGGEVLFALNIAAWPEDLPAEELARVFEGAVEMVREAGGVIAGGHTITDKEPKFGLAVTGQVDPRRILVKARVAAGDALWLTKPIGLGLLTTAHKRGSLGASDLALAITTMTSLNRAAARAAVAADLHAATDVTGFGLAGHAFEMADASGVRITLRLADLPLLGPARELAASGVAPGGTERNRTHFLAPERVRSEGLDAVALDLFFDPQTSGGLLVAVPPPHEAAWERARNEHGVHAWRIGEASAGRGVVLLP